MAIKVLNLTWSKVFHFFVVDEYVLLSCISIADAIYLQFNLTLYLNALCGEGLP